MSENDIIELKGQIIDIFEDYLTDTCVTDKDHVFIKNEDYDKIGDKIVETLKNWKLI